MARQYTSPRRQDIIGRLVYNDSSEKIDLSQERIWAAEDALLRYAIDYAKKNNKMPLHHELYLMMKGDRLRFEASEVKKIYQSKRFMSQLKISLDEEFGGELDG